ncbi:diguanylate cyclase [Marinobacter sp. 1_MG-2023]|uniref:sensor domain-containing protein n=1 Tax=Marinobacter sp. 1_MG-2023 TaxID=3062627 RepID=UPI0026E11F8A|nr:diguanylate cyclase [Marinobacter sp. 1_MG-2023]MDO6822892.1 diguanylate cyclase [Marinobacter sp. 1_MG-2023]
MPGVSYPNNIPALGSQGAYSRTICHIGWAVIVISSLVMLSWGLDIEVGKRLRPSFQSMKFNTAFCFLICGLLFHRQSQSGETSARDSIVACLGVFLLVISGLTLLQYGLGWQLGIDNLVIQDLDTPPEDWPGRMSAGTALCFSLMGVAWLINAMPLRHSIVVLQLLALAVIVISGAALIGYIFGVQRFRLPLFSTMALHTAALFVVCGAGMLMVRPHAGVMSSAASAYIGGRSLRRLLPYFVVTPVLIGWLSMEGVVAGYYTEAFGFALSSLSSILVLTCVGWLGAGALNREEERFRSTVDSSPVATLMVDRRGTIQIANQLAHSLFRCPQGHLVNRQVERLLPERFRSEPLTFQREYLEGGERRILGSGRDLFALRQDGSEFRAEIALNPVQTADGHSIIVAILDITARVEAELKVLRLNRIHKVLSGINTLILRAQTLDALYEGATWIAVEKGELPAAIVVEHDKHSGLLNIRHAHAENTQLQARSLSGFETDAIYECLQTHQVVTRNNLAQQEGNVDLAGLVGQGIQALASFPLTTQGQPLDAALVLYRCEPFSFDQAEMELLREVAGDISFAIANLEKSQELEYLTHFDSVTDLPNRLLLTDRLRQAMIQADRWQGTVIVLYVNINGFKQVNEKLGFSGGDDVLRQVARRVGACIGQADTVSRWGGDEFIVLLPGQSAADASEVAHLITDALKSAIQLEDGRDVLVSCRVGAAEYPRDGLELDAIINSARTASSKAS